MPPLMGEGAGPYTLFFTNHGYAPEWSGHSLEEAVAQARRYHFDATIYYRGKLVGSWGVLSGFRRYEGSRGERQIRENPESQRGGVHVDIYSHNPGQTRAGRFLSNPVDKSLRRAVNFFREHAGYVVGRKMAGALDLARAERWAASEGVIFEWSADDDADLSWMTEKERDEPHEVLCCMASLDGARASLCGIVDPDRNYQRVIEAELASELQGEVG